MAADIILEDHLVRIVEGDLKIDNRSIHVGEGDDSVSITQRGTLSVRRERGTTHISGPRIISHEVFANTIEANEIHLGSGSATEPGDAGVITVEDGHGNETARLEGRTGNLILGGDGEDGDVLVRNSDGELTVGVNGRTGNITCGGGDTDGDLVLMDSEGRRLIFLDAGETADIDDSVTIYADGKEADLVVGRRLNDGSLTLVDRTGEARVRIGGYQDPSDVTASTAEPDEVTSGSGEPDQTRVRIDHEGSMRLGGDGEDGRIRLRAGDGSENVMLDAGGGTVRVGNLDPQNQGRLLIIDEFGTVGVELENKSVKAGAVRAGRISAPNAFREEHAVVADHVGLRIGRMDSDDNYEETLRLASDGTITAADVELGTIQSLVQTIQDLQNRVQQLETTVSNLTS